MENPKFSGDPLISPFTLNGAWAAVKAMNINNDLGPHGFGPAWYSATWSVTGKDVMDFLSKFHANSVDMDKNKHGHIILPPKSTGHRSKRLPTILYKNCLVKLLTKIFTTRLQR
jgi:hypothetical protein